MPLFGIQIFLSEADLAQCTVINIYAVLIATPRDRSVVCAGDLL